jgi:G:T-mismatch repair DNA endonuclease (very short patch repair protein)
VQAIAENQLKTWARTTQEKRKKGGSYSRDNTADYWMAKLKLSYEDALEKANQHKREKSPFSVDHWIKKGFSKEDARRQAKKYHVRGGIASTKKQGSICTSNLESQIYNLLVADVPDIQMQYSIEDIYVYDFCLPSSKKIIEVNGTYWHADPRVYSENDAVHDVLAKKIWNRDKKKLGYAKHAGYDVLVVWELDFCKSKQDTLNLIKAFLQQD